MTASGPAITGPRTYDVVGLFGHEFGLTVAARNSVAALRASGREVDTVSVVANARVRAAARAPRSGPGRINLLHLNPLDLGAYAPQWRPAVERDAPNVCVPFWELPLLPRSWIRMLGAMHAILAPTRFVQEACAAALPAVPVLHYPQAVFLPAGVAPARERFGLSRSATVFLVSFDVGSDIDRKNPWDALEAFQRAFPPGDDVELVVKMKPWQNAPRFAAQAEALRRRAAPDPRIRFVEASFGYDEVLALYASCDVMLSLHRSEGLGLHLMEAMSLGKPVVATGWSGNADFMTAENSVPVGSRLVPVRTDHFAYRSELGRAGQVWAQPDVGEAVAALRTLHASAARRRALGEAAAASMAARREAMNSGAVYGALEEAIAGVAVRAGSFDRTLALTRARFWLSAVEFKVWDVRQKLAERRRGAA